MRPRIPVSFSFAIGVSGCLFFSACTSDPEVSDPYQGLSCQEKIDKMAREVNAFAGNRQPAARIAVNGSDSADSARKTIVLFRGYPPVVQTDPIPVPVQETDSRAAGNPDSVHWGVTWIPPVGFSDTAWIGSSAQPDTQGEVAPETTAPVLLPMNISTIKIVSSGAYRSHIRIFDYKRDLIREFDQDFGYRGELENPQRIVPQGKVSYLVWDNTDADGHRPADGLYTWQVRVTLSSRKVIDTTAMTGLLDPACTNPP